MTVTRNERAGRFFSFALLLLLLLPVLLFSVSGCGGGTKRETNSGGDTGRSFVWDAPEKEYAYGVDVSYWQGDIDWQRVRDAGIGFAIVRVGYRSREDGTIKKDVCADANLRMADEAGILTGAYFYSGAMTVAEAEEEADWLIGAIRGYAISAPVVFDHEITDPAVLDAGSRTDCALAFLSRVRAAGYDGAVYGSAKNLLYTQVWQIDRIAPEYRVWVARYPEPAYPETALPGYSHRVDLWQYTNEGEVDGISRPVDRSVSYYEMTYHPPKDPSARPAEEDPLVTDQTFAPVSDMVTAKDEVTLRRLPGTDEEAVGVLQKGDYLTRTGVGDKGWSRLLYEGHTVYAVTSYLTDGQGEDSAPAQTFRPVVRFVTAKDEVNLRLGPSTDSKVIAVLRRGMYLTCTGEGDMGWSRLLYEGQTVYAVTSYLTEDGDAYETEPETEPDPASGHTFSPVNEQVTAKEETNLRAAPSTDAPILRTLYRGETVTRTGVGDKGWSRLSFDGVTAYAVTSLLMSEADAQAEEQTEEQTQKDSRAVTEGES